MEQIQWRRYAQGIWTTTVGRSQGLTPLALAEREPKLDELERMGPAALPFELNRVELELTESAYIVRVPLEPNEQIYGLGLHFMRMNHRGRTRYLRVNSDPRQDTGETHAPVPFYVTDRGYGVLIDTSRIVTAFCGSTVRLKDNRLVQVKDRNTDRSWKATMQSEYVELSFPKDGAEVYVISGPTVMDAVRRYNLLCGGGTLPPKWGLGFWHRVPTLFSHQEVLEEAMEFRRRDFPCDVIGLEPGWHSESYPVTYEWDASRFPNPRKTVGELADAGFRINLWENPYVSPKAAGLYEKLEPLSGSYTVWGGLAPDYSLQEARQLYKEQHLQVHVDIGVLGYKHDECDGSELTNHSWMFPAHAQFPSGHDGEQMRQLYGLMFQKMGDELFRSRNRRTYGLVRASNAGASSMPYVLYSDLYDHKQFIRALCNSSFCGLLWTPEVRRAANADDWVRRMQAVCLSPLAMLNAWGDGTKPWSYPETADTVRRYIKLRMRLLPYLYTAFAQYRFQGTPPFRAMPLVMNMSDLQSYTITGEALNTTDGAYGKQTGNQWDDQFMIGDSLLVAPLFAGETSRDVLLPPGVWYGLETGERVEGGRVIRVDAPLELLPVYVRDGAVIPTIKAIPHAPRSGERVTLHFIHFGDAPGEFHLYDDDGETFDYEQGQHHWLHGKVTRDGNGDFQGELSGEITSTMSYDKVKWTFGVKRLPDDEHLPS